jgi:hypothetical protein
MSKVVMPDPGSRPGQALIRHPVLLWIPAFAGMTVLAFMVAGVIIGISNRQRACEKEMFLVFPYADKKRKSKW